MTGEFSSGSGSPRDREMECCREMPSECLSAIIGKVNTNICIDNDPGGVVHDGNTETKSRSRGWWGIKVLRTFKKTEPLSDLSRDIGVIRRGVDGDNEWTASVGSSWRIGDGPDKEPYSETRGVVGSSTEMSNNGGRRSLVGKS